MANSEVTTVVENLKEKAVSNVKPLETKSENSTAEGLEKSKGKWPTMKEIVDPEGPFLPKWNIIFIVSCVIAVLLDPLFLYIPIINEDMKCLRVDKNLKIAALVLRSITDLCYLLNIFFQVYRSKNCSALRSGSCSSFLPTLRKILPDIAKTMWQSYILIDILAVLPLPQVMILVFISKIRGSGSINTGLVNFFVLVQYVPRLLRIYLACKESKTYSSQDPPIWLKGVLNFFMYILASHVLGAMWYFFAIQQITTCWRNACRNANGCDPNNFDCYDHHALRNITSLTDMCPIDPENSKLFDFGIYLDILQFGILGSTDIPVKLSFCFWWGLRNLSSLGSNLNPGINTWENLFTAFISVIGLLLVVYLIGNLQTYMQLDTARLETHRWKVRIEKKKEKKELEVEAWLLKNGIPLDKKSEIMETVLLVLKENKEVDVENILTILPLQLQDDIRSSMRKREEKDQEVEAWLLKNGVSLDKKSEIMETVLLLLTQNKEVDVENILTVLPSQLQVDIKSLTNMNLLSSSMAEVPKSSEKWPTLKEIVDPKGPFVGKWNVIFIVSCVLSVLLDPLFLYIPIVNEDMKCLRMDRNLKITALVLRSLTDLFYILSIFFQAYRYNNSSASGLGSCRSIFKNIIKIMSHSYILIDILAVLPLPQVAVLILLPKTRGSASWETLMNFLVLVQYMPRVLRIYLSCKESAMTSREETPIWIKGVLNLFLYILASHVLGAFWYFFAVQRITTCWQNACQKESGCEPNNFDCHDYHTLRNITFLGDSCPVDPANAKLFDFGMFLDVLQFGILGSTNYPEKFAKCFWWGLQNLSSLGSNLPLSIHTWENLFAAFVSVIGLLLFLYLIGNLQTYMQLDVARLENHRWKMRIKKKMDEIDGEIKKWVAENGLPSNKKSDIMAKVEVEFKENRNVVVEDIMSILPSDLQSYVNNCMPLTRLRKVPLLQNVDEAVLIEISEYLKPQKYKKDDIIITEDKPLEMMIIIVDGLVSIEKRGASSTLQRRAEQLYGEQVLCWPAWTSSPGMSHESVRANNDVEVLVFTVSDMEHVGSKFRSEFTKDITLRSDAKWKLLETDKVAMLRKVPKLDAMDDQVLEAISLHLTFKRYENNMRLLEKGKPLGMMIFVTGRTLFVSHRPGVAEEEYDIEGFSRHTAGYYCGEELLDWVLDRSFPALLPTSTYTAAVPYSGGVEVLVLMADALASVVSQYRSSFSRVITQTTDLFASLTLYWLKNVPMFEDMDEEALKEISKHMKHKSYDSEKLIIDEHKPLEMMVVLLKGDCLVVDGYPVIFVGDFYGLELVHWITNWTSHTNFPAKLPLCSGYAMTSDNSAAEVAIIWADDLKRIVSQFRSDFMRQTTLPVDSEGKLSTLDRLTMVKKVPILENMDEIVLKAICSHLKPMKYSDDMPDGTFGFKWREKIDKMFFIISGLVCYRNNEEVVSYRYSGNYFGEELVEWVLDGSIDKEPRCWGLYKCVGEVEVLVLMAEDLAKVVSEFKTHFVRQITTAFLMDSHSDSD